MVNYGDVVVYYFCIRVRAHAREGLRFDFGLVSLWDFITFNADASSTGTAFCAMSNKQPVPLLQFLGKPAVQFASQLV